MNLSICFYIHKKSYITINNNNNNNNYNNNNEVLQTVLMAAFKKPGEMVK